MRERAREMGITGWTDRYIVRDRESDSMPRLTDKC